MTCRIHVLRTTHGGVSSISPFYFDVQKSDSTSSQFVLNYAEHNHRLTTGTIKNQKENLQLLHTTRVRIECLIEDVTGLPLQSLSAPGFNGQALGCLVS